MENPEKFNDGICRNYIIWKCYKKAKRMRSVLKAKIEDTGFENKIY